jgi:hypothetical protein
MTAPDGIEMDEEVNPCDLEPELERLHMALTDMGLSPDLVRISQSWTGRYFIGFNSSQLPMEVAWRLRETVKAMDKYCCWECFTDDRTWAAECWADRPFVQDCGRER